MEPIELEMAEKLGRILENVIITEEKSLQKGYFSNLSIAEMHTLDAIGPYESRTMSETAAILGITTGTLTVSVDRLVKKGYIDRKRDEKDRRIVRVSLTRRGKLASRMHGKFHYVLARHVLEPYTKEEQELLSRFVSEIDIYLSRQATKYNDKESIRKTAASVANDIRRRQDNG